MTAIMQTVASFEETIKKDETIGPVVKDLERTFLFTDVPCGAMKFNEKASTEVSPEVQDDVSKTLLTFCGGLERAFCFSDLEDVQEDDKERLRSMKSLQDQQDESATADAAAVTKETAAGSEQPAIESADTESMSDESVKEEPTLQEKPKDSKAVKTVKAAVAAATNDTLPPKNAFQSSTHKTKSGKPLNALQAAKAARKQAKAAGKKNNNKKGWSLFRKSNKATV